MRRPPELHEYVCVAHVHSLHSDGTGTVAEIAQAAAQAEVDVVLLTDHDTLAARDAGEERWWDRVLVLVGCEISPRGGNHYLAFGLERPIDPRARTIAEICSEVREQGGFGFAAHPASRGVPRLGPVARPMPFAELATAGADGVEVWSFVTDTVERLPGARSIPSFLARPAHWLEHPREEVLKEWDELGRRRRCPAIGGVDAHQVGLRVGRRVPVRLMAYRRSFRFLRTHVLTTEPLRGDLERDRALVFDALREGRSFVATDCFGPTRGFRFWAERGEQTVAMGGEVRGNGWTLRAIAPRPALLRLLRDGVVVDQHWAPALARRIEGPGVWRVEAQLEVDGRPRTWVLTNPIYVRPDERPGAE